MKRVLIILLLSLSFGLQAQNTSGNIPILDRDIFILNWEVAFPTGSDFLSETSFRNGRIEYRHLIDRNWAWGASIGWNSFNQPVDQQLYEEEDGSRAVFTDLIRQVYQIPFSANGYYYFGDSDSFRPYAGLGLGGNYAEQEAYFNIYVLRDSNWGFYLRPELGAQYLFNRGFGMIFYVSYNYASNTSDFFGNVDGLSHVGLGLGFTWSW